MRDLNRNRRELWFSRPISQEPVLDEYGNDTLEVETIYSTPVRIMANVSASMGQEVREVFGAYTDYSRTVSFTGTVGPLGVGDLVWFGELPVGEANYTVVRVADSKNGFLVALREVSPHG